MVIGFCLVRPRPTEIQAVWRVVFARNQIEIAVAIHVGREDRPCVMEFCGILGTPYLIIGVSFR